MFRKISSIFDYLFSNQSISLEEFIESKMILVEDDYTDLEIGYNDFNELLRSSLRKPR